MDNKTALLGVLQSYAPDSAAQKVCSAIVWRAESEGGSPLSIERALIIALSDGIMYGNWPWSKTIKMR